MDRENKYYSVIENLVRQHKKFVGLESIIEDIIDDVYSHSEVILKSVANESVINAYLEKVVSTSIITVPKKMKFQPEIKPRNIVLEDLIVKEEKYKKADNALVDKMINSSEKKEFTPAVIEPEEVIEITEPENNNLSSKSMEEVSLFENTDEKLNETNKEDSNILLSDTLEQDETKEENISELSVINIEPNEQDETFENNTLEELSENNNSSFVIEEPVDTIEAQDDIIIFDENTNSAFEQEPVEQEENSIVFKDEIFEEADNEEEPETLSTFEESEPFSFESSDTDSSLNVIDTELSDSIEEIPEVINIAEENDDLTEENNEESIESFLDNQVNNEMDSTVEGSFEQEDNNELEFFSDDGSELSLETSDNLLISEDEDTLDNALTEEPDDIVELAIASDVQEESSKSSFKPIDYSNFAFIPDTENENLDVDSIVKELEELDSKKPELDIINIYNLKYKENLKVSQIASKLDVSENFVIDALNEIITVV